MKFFHGAWVQAIVIFSMHWLLPVSAIAGDNQPVLLISQKSRATNFENNELPKRLSEKVKFKELADKTLSDWCGKRYDQSMESAGALAKSARPKREEIAGITTMAESMLQSGDSDKAGALHVIAYQALKVGGKATVEDAIQRTFRIASIISASKTTTDADRAFASSLLQQALQTRRIAGGLLDSDAPLLLLHARLEFSLKRWGSSQKDYEFWLGMYESKGRNPPASDLPDALGELGISNMNQKNLPRAEEYFRRACEAASALNGTTVTPINGYDVEDFLIFNLLTQNKLDAARELAQEHLKYKEKTLGFRSPQLAEELNRYADLFEQAGETAYSFSLRARAGKVISP